MKPGRGITFKLTLVFVLFAAVLLAGGGALAYVKGRQQILDSFMAELEIASAEKQAALEGWVADRESDVVAMASSPALVAGVEELLAAPPGSPQAEAAHARVVAELRARVGPGQPYRRWLVVEPEEGRVIADSDGGEEGKYRENRPYFIYGKVGPFVQNVYYSLALHAPAMTASAPLRDADGRLAAVLAARLDLANMNAIIQRRTGRRQTDDAFLVNTSSLFITQPRRVADPAVLSRGIHTEAVRRCLAGEGGVILADDYRGVPAIVNYAWLPARNMCLIVKVDQAEAFAPVEAFGRSVILGAVVALLVIAAIAVGLARSITRPVLALQEGAARFGQGELDTRLPDMGADELGALAREFNRMAAALSREQTQLRRHLERMYALSSDLICAAGFDGYFKDVNPAFEKSLGYRRDELLSQPFVEFVHPDDREATLAAAASLAQGRAVAGFENRYRCKDGSWKWLFWNASSDLDEQLIYAMAHDVTTRKQAEAALRSSEARLAGVITSAMDAIISVDADQRIVLFNAAAEQMFRCSAAEALGQPLERFVPQRYRAAHRTHIRVFGETGATSRSMGALAALSAVRAGGEEFPIEASISQIVVGEQRLFTVILRDITERQQAEEALAEIAQELARSNAELEQFAYVASHDLQEPLRMVTSYLQLLQRRYQGQLDADADEFIAYAVDGAARMKTLINDLLAYSRAGTRGAGFEPADCQAVLERVLDDLQVMIQESGATITHDPLPTVTADATQLAQLLQNLIGNALKFRNQAPPCVHVGAERQGNDWVFRVQDNGIGLEPQYAERIFAIFQRLHNREDYPGTGIGLAISKRIVERHGGRIWVESQPGQGSTFYFTIPIRSETATERYEQRV
jgi:PAS domain S-box-containing protein